LRPLRLLLEGPPKVGKTMVMRHLVQLLQEGGAVVGGFVMDEMRERDRRVGFVVRDVAGPKAVMAHQDFQTDEAYSVCHERRGGLP
jgi:nucleoside-triphosphatase